MILALAQLAGNHLLESDSMAMAKLHKLQGKVIALNIKPSANSTQAHSVFLYCQENEIEFTNKLLDDDAFDVALTTTLPALVKIGQHGMEDADLKPGELHIEGDVIVGQRFAHMLTELDIDWEDIIAQQIGDTPARLLTLGANQARSLAGHGKSFIKEQLKELLHEQKLVSDSANVEQFLDDVDGLRADVDRLQARIERLKKQL